jgi:hypothetical protein
VEKVALLCLSKCIHENERNSFFLAASFVECYVHDKEEPGKEELGKKD